MSFTRAHDDECQYSQELKQNQSVLTHVMDPNMYYNCNPCRVDFGVVGGNTVSLYGGNLVDLESDLRRQTRQFGLCSTMKFQPGTVVQGKTQNCTAPCGTDGLPCGSLSCRKEDLKHLPVCSMINYKKRQSDIGYKLEYPDCATAQAHPTFAHNSNSNSNSKKQTKGQKTKQTHNKPYVPVSNVFANVPANY